MWVKTLKWEKNGWLWEYISYYVVFARFRLRSFVFIYVHALFSRRLDFTLFLLCVLLFILFIRCFVCLFVFALLCFVLSYLFNHCFLTLLFFLFPLTFQDGVELSKTKANKSP